MEKMEEELIWEFVLEWLRAMGEVEALNVSLSRAGGPNKFGDSICLTFTDKGKTVGRIIAMEKLLAVKVPIRSMAHMMAEEMKKDLDQCVESNNHK